MRSERVHNCIVEKKKKTVKEEMDNKMVVVCWVFPSVLPMQPLSLFFFFVCVQPEEEHFACFTDKC